MAKPFSRSERPNSFGTEAGAMPETTVSQAYSAALRWTGARQSSATLSFSRANFTQKERPSRSTRAMSEATPPVRGSTAVTSQARPRPMSSTRARHRRSKAALSFTRMAPSGGEVRANPGGCPARSRGGANALNTIKLMIPWLSFW